MFIRITTISIFSVSVFFWSMTDALAVQKKIIAKNECVQRVNDAEMVGKKSYADALFRMRTLSLVQQKIYQKKHKDINFDSSMAAWSLLCDEEFNKYEFGDISVDMGWLSSYEYEGIDEKGYLIYIGTLYKDSSIGPIYNNNTSKEVTRYAINVINRDNKYCIVPYNLRNNGYGLWVDPFVKQEKE
jgi:hypothetical protein